MLQTRWCTVRPLQRCMTGGARYYADVKPSDSANPPPVAESTQSGNVTGTESEHAASAGHHEPTHHDHHPIPSNESLGRGFYVAVAGLAASLALYKFSRSSSADPASAGDPARQPMITRFIQRFDYIGEQFAARNKLHADAVQQAGDDKSLFEGTPRSGHIDLKFPEVFNTGSPWNVPAGSTANLDHLREHYRKQTIEMEEERRAKREIRERSTRNSVEGDLKDAIDGTVEAVKSVGQKATKGQ